MIKHRVVEIFYFDAGGGHRSAMNALCEVLADVHPDWMIKPINLQELLEPIDPIYRVTDKLSVIREVLDDVKPKLSPVFQKFLEVLAPKLTFRTLQSDQFYNEMLKRGVKSGLDILLPILQSLIRLASGKIQSMLKQHWLGVDYRPDLVISVIPNFNAVMFRALKKIHPAIPFVTIMTDLVDIPPHFWMENQDQVLICGTLKAYRQALATRFYRDENVHQVSGMILKKRFYEPETKNRMPEMPGLSSSPSIRTALVMFGGNGAAVAESIVDQLNASGMDIQTIVMCGHNKALYECLKGKKNCCPVPFVADVVPYMRRADFMIGKPGPGSISEAVHMGCPVLVEGNAATMPQERPNIDWILENGVGFAVKDFEAGIAEAAERMIVDLDIYQRNIGKLVKNRAVYEIAEILERVAENASISANENKPEAAAKYPRLSPLLLKSKRPRWKRILKKAR